ncbi:MAG: dienelactone hydrolase family protein [Oceanipulchritudo sp.]
MKTKLLLITLLGACGIATAGEFAEKTVTYEIGDTVFESTMVWESENGDPRPGILMVPNWMGPTEASLEKARKVAAYGYVVMMVDMYGVGVRPKDASEAGKAAGAVRADRAMMRNRAAKALAVFRSTDGIPLQADKVAAIGFCFGGGTVLEMARGGADVDAVISFHGDLMSPTLESDAANTTAKVLVLHGAEDPYVPQEHVQAFVGAMLQTDADWQLVQFSGTVHSFTDSLADSPGFADFNPVSAARAFQYMEELLEELWNKKKK